MNVMTTIQNDTIDLVCWRFYGRTAGVTEQVLQANPQISSCDVILPVGTTINLPDIIDNQQNKATIQLWD